jgi:signal-transduction protein with cAMP-binding, CBS, and nucleotidyltransferase domain
VTIGNIIGGGLLVASVYWFVYLRRAAAQPIRRLMTEGPVAVEPGISVGEAVQVMKQHNTGSVLVGPPGGAIGIVSQADIVHKVTGAGGDPASVQVDQIMSTPIISADVGTGIYAIYRTMADNNVRHLIITEDGRQVGFVSVKDLLKQPGL